MKDETIYKRYNNIKDKRKRTFRQNIIMTDLEICIKNVLRDYTEQKITSEQIERRIEIIFSYYNFYAYETDIQISPLFGGAIFVLFTIEPQKNYGIFQGNLHIGTIENSDFEYNIKHNIMRPDKPHSKPQSQKINR
jgi:hypothetical protein